MADIEDLMPLIKQFMPYAQEKMGFQDPPRLFLKGDSDNAANPLGRTAFYDPAEKAVTLYITSRHPKDIMRSLSHELVHHCQNCNGDFENAGEMGAGYAQSNPHMREMERQAYEIGNMCFRDWEDSIKQTIYFEHLQKGDYTMSTKDWKNGEIKTLLSEAWGFKMDLNKLNEVSDNYDSDDTEAGEVATAETKGTLEEDSGKEEKRHYEDDDWSDKDRLDAILDHAHKLREDMDYDHDHEALQEESGEEEKHHYEHADWSDKDRLEQIIGHAEALRKDMDYDHDHEALEEEVEEVDEGCGDMPDEGEVVIDVSAGEEGVEVGPQEPAARVGELMDELKGLLMQLTGGEEEVAVTVDEPMEERRAKGRSSARNQRGVPDPRQRPGAAMQENRMREMVRKAIKDAMK